MEEEIRVSVIMGVYNQPDREILSGAVRSILNQTESNLEFLIYDDGSDDGTSEILQTLSREDERIVLLGAKENHGLAFSLNACIQRAKGTYIARMDADDLSDPERLEKQCGFLDAHPEVSWCGCNARLIDENGVWGCRRMPEHPQKNDFLRYSPFIHPTVVYRRDVFNGEAGYAETADMLRCEDYEIFMRLFHRGVIGVNMQETLFSYREDAASYKRRSLTSRLHEAELRFHSFAAMKILFPVGWLYVLRPLAGGLLPAELIRRIKHGQDKNEYN